MKTLVISYDYPLPENGGSRIRTMNFARFFEKLGDTDLLYYHHEGKKEEKGTPFKRSFFVDISDGKKQKNRISYLYEKFKYSKPWAVPDYSKQSINKIVNIIKEQDYDHILCRYAINAFPLFELPDIYKRRTIVDIDDIITGELYEAGNKDTFGLKKIKAKIDFKLYQKFQLKCAALGKALICSENDIKTINKQKNPGNIFIVPNITPSLNIFREYNKNGYCNIGTILFVGNLEYGPNEQGIIWFIREIFSRMICSGEQIKLVIIGKKPTPQLTAICKEYDQIKLVDTPPDVLPFYNTCGAVIVPLLAGGGTRIKILEAGHVLRPIITTKIGAYGLNLTDCEHVLYFDDYHSFVEKYDLLKNIKKYEQLTHNMSNYVLDNYSIGTFEKAMGMVIIS